MHGYKWPSNCTRTRTAPPLPAPARRDGQVPAQRGLGAQPAQNAARARDLRLVDRADLGADDPVSD